MKRPIILLVLMGVMAMRGPAQSTGSGDSSSSTNTTDHPADPDAAKRWQELHDQNLILDEQQKLLTGQQNLFKSYLPTLPQGAAPGLERKGDLSIKGTTAAYEVLQTIARRIARNVGDVSGTPPADCS
jgi:hypothetical protein